MRRSPENVTDENSFIDREFPAPMLRDVLNANAARVSAVLGVFLPPLATAGMDPSTPPGPDWELAAEK